MNANTKKALIEFIEEVEQMAIGCAHMIGSDQVRDVVQKAEALKLALGKDKTIP